MDHNDRYNILRLLVEKLSEYVDESESIRVDYENKTYVYEQTDGGWKLRLLEDVDF